MDVTTRSGDPIPTPKNPDFVGKKEAAKAAEKSSGPGGTERVWDFICAEPKCPKPKTNDSGDPIKHKTKPVGQVPKKNCDGCDTWNWQKLPGDRERAKAPRKEIVDAKITGNGAKP